MRARGTAPSALLTAAAFAVLTAACSVKAPPRASWTIVPEDRPQATARAAEGAPRLGVARFTAAPEVRSTDLTWRSDDGMKLTQTDDRWVDYPDRMLEEVVRGQLLASGSFASVGPATPASGIDALLHARLLDFTEWHSGEGVDVRVSIEWRLTQPSGEVLAQDVVSASEPLAERTVAGAVAAYQRAARAVAAELSGDVVEALRPMAAR